jgi:hypothetical protein
MRRHAFQIATVAIAFVLLAIALAAILTGVPLSAVVRGRGRLRAGARKSARPTWEGGWIREARPVLLPGI